MTENFSEEEAKKELERAEKSLRSAQVLLKDNLLEDAIITCLLCNTACCKGSVISGIY